MDGERKRLASLGAFAMMKNTGGRGLERRVRGSENWLLFQRTLVQLPTPQKVTHSCLSLQSSRLGHLNLCGTYKLTTHTHTNVNTNLYRKRMHWNKRNGEFYSGLERTCWSLPRSYGHRGARVSMWPMPSVEGSHFPFRASLSGRPGSCLLVVILADRS